MNEKKRYVVVNESKFYPEKYLENPIGVCSYQAYHDLQNVCSDLQKLNEYITKLQEEINRLNVDVSCMAGRKVCIDCTFGELIKISEKMIEVLGE